MRTRRGPVLLISLLVAAPGLAACGASAEVDELIRERREEAKREWSS